MVLRSLMGFLRDGTRVKSDDRLRKSRVLRRLLATVVELRKGQRHALLQIGAKIFHHRFQLAGECRRDIGEAARKAGAGFAGQPDGLLRLHPACKTRRDPHRAAAGAVAMAFAPGTSRMDQACQSAPMALMIGGETFFIFGKLLLSQDCLHSLGAAKPSRGAFFARGLLQFRPFDLGGAGGIGRGTSGA